jgi:ribosomal protein L32
MWFRDVVNYESLIKDKQICKNCSDVKNFHPINLCYNYEGKFKEVKKEIVEQLSWLNYFKSLVTAIEPIVEIIKEPVYYNYDIKSDLVKGIIPGLEEENKIEHEQHKKLLEQQKKRLGTYSWSDGEPLYREYLGEKEYDQFPPNAEKAEKADVSKDDLLDSPCITPQTLTKVNWLSLVNLKYITNGIWVDMATCVLNLLTYLTNNKSKPESLCELTKSVSDLDTNKTKNFENIKCQICKNCGDVKFFHKINLCYNYEGKFKEVKKEIVEQLSWLNYFKSLVTTIKPIVEIKEPVNYKYDIYSSNLEKEYDQVIQHMRPPSAEKAAISKDDLLDSSNLEKEYDQLVIQRRVDTSDWESNAWWKAKILTDELHSRRESNKKPSNAEKAAVSKDDLLDSPCITPPTLTKVNWLSLVNLNPLTYLTNNKSKPESL